MGNTIKLKGQWKEVKNLFNARGFSSRLKAEQTRYLEAIGIALQGLMIQIIVTDKPFKENSALTVALKGSSTPLVNDGDLVGAITHLVAGKVVFIGVLRGSDSINIAEILHDGAKIKVSKAMRGFFYALHKKNPAIKPLKKSTKYIIIPARPFAKETLEDKGVRPFITQNGQKMLTAALTGRKAVYTPALR